MLSRKGSVQGIPRYEQATLICPHQPSSILLPSLNVSSADSVVLLLRLTWCHNRIVDKTRAAVTNLLEGRVALTWKVGNPLFGAIRMTGLAVPCEI